MFIFMFIYRWISCLLFKKIFNLSVCEVSNFMKIRPVGAELFHTKGQIDKHDRANSHFSRFFGSP
jgi:hypothetical protein